MRKAGTKRTNGHLAKRMPIAHARRKLRRPRLLAVAPVAPCGEQQQTLRRRIEAVSLHSHRPLHSPDTPLDQLDQRTRKTGYQITRMPR